MVIDCPEADLNKAKQVLSAAKQPFLPETLATEVAIAISGMKARAEDHNDTKLYIAGLVNDLKDFPADVVRSGLRQIRLTTPFRPAPSEVYEKMTKLNSKRDSFDFTLSNPIQARKSKEKAEPVSEETLVACQEMIDGLASKMTGKELGEKNPA